MPELPEVETVARALRPRAVGRTIVGFETNWPKQITTHDPESFAQAVRGQTIIAVQRRGKYLLLGLSGGWWLIVHLRMTGHLSVVSAESPHSRFDHLWFDLDGGEQLRFRDIRKFGTVMLVADPLQVVGKLGPEPFSAEFTPQLLAERLAKRNAPIKAVLLDQTVVAGIGNIYADEALFGANIAPLRPASSLNEEEIGRLHHAILQVLQLGIDREGASITNYLKPDGEKGQMQDAVNVFRRTGAPCYVCGMPIVRIKVTQRSTHFCPHCQK